MADAPTPAALWRVAHDEHPHTPAALDLYRALMVKAGYLVLRKPGGDRSLPCGYDPFDSPGIDSTIEEATDGLR